MESPEVAQIARAVDSVIAPLEATTDTKIAGLVRAMIQIVHDELKSRDGLKAPSASETKQLLCDKLIVVIDEADRVGFFAEPKLG